MPITPQQLEEALSLSEEFPDDLEIVEGALAIADAYEAEGVQRRGATRNLFTDREKHGLPDETLTDIAKIYNGDTDQKYRIFNNRFFREFGGIPDEQIQALGPSLRKQYSLKTWGEEVTDEKAFYERQASEFEFEDEFSQKAQQFALSGAPMHEADAALDFDYVEDPRYKGREDARRKQFQAAYQGVKSQLAGLEPTAQVFVEQLKNQMGVGEGTGQAALPDEWFLETVMDIPKEKRDIFLSAVAARAGEGEAKTLFQAMAERMGRTATDIVRASNATARLTKLDQLARHVATNGAVSGLPDEFGFSPDEYLTGYLVSKEAADRADKSKVPAIGSEEFKALSPEQQTELERIEEEREFTLLYKKVNDIATGVIDPAKGSNYYTSGAIGVAGMLPNLGLMAMGPAGMAVNARGYISQRTLDHAAANPGVDTRDSIAIGAAQGIGETMLDLIPTKIIAGRTPLFSKWLNKATLTKGGLTGRAAVRVGAGTVFEGATEFAQDVIVPSAVEDLASALKSDIPEANWDARLAGFTSEESLSELIPSIIMLSLIGSGVGGVRDYKGGWELVGNRNLLIGAGINEADADAIVSAAQRDDAAGAQTLLRDSFAKLDQTKEISDVLPEARKRAIQNIQAEIEMRIEAEEKGEISGIIPKLGRDEGGFYLRFQDSSTRYYKSQGEASQARWDYASEKRLDELDQFRGAISMVERGARVGEEFDFAFENRRDDLRQARERGEVTDAAVENRIEQAKRIGGQKDPAQEIEQGETDIESEYQDRFTAAELQAVLLDDRAAAFQILGSNKIEYADGITRFVIRLKQGATPLTVFEEKIEGDAQVMLREKGGREWLLSRLRSYERVSGEMLLPANDAEVTSGDLREAYSHFGMSYLVGRTRKSERGENFVDPGRAQIQKMMRNAQRSGLAVAGEGYTEFFREVMKRAAKLNKLRREGKLDADLERELARSVGFGEQAEYEASVEAEAETNRQALEDMGFEAEVEASTFEPTDDAPFSVIALEKTLLDEIPNLSKLFLQEGGDYIEIKGIEVKKSGRGQGAGAATLDRIKEYAQIQGKQIVLTAQPEAGKKAALYRFYKNAGFKLPGNKRDFSLPRHTHIWQPVEQESTFKPTDDAPFSVVNTGGMGQNRAINSDSSASGENIAPDSQADIEARDTAYLEAIERGDENSAWIALVDTAKARGRVLGFHGTDASFTEWDFDAPRRTGTLFGVGWAWFSDNKKTASSYGKNVLRRFLNLQDPHEAFYNREIVEFGKAEFNVRIERSWGDAWATDGREVIDFTSRDEAQKWIDEDSKDSPWTQHMLQNEASEAERKNSQSIIIRGIDDSLGSELLAPTDVYAVRDARQIESGELVIRDESGNIIPPSKRFPSNDQSASEQSDASLSVITNAESRIAESFNAFLRNPEQRRKIVLEAQRRGREQASKFDEIIRRVRSAGSLSREAKVREGLEYDRLLRETFGATTQAEQEALPAVDRAAARSDAAKVAADWKKAQEKSLGNIDRELLIGAMRTLDAMISALPVEIRGKMGGMVRLAQFKGPEALVNELEKRSREFDRVLEKWLKDEATKEAKDFFATVKKKIKTEAGKKAEAQALPEMIVVMKAAEKAFKSMSAEQGQARGAEITGLLLSGKVPDNDVAAMQMMAELIPLFSGWNGRTEQQVIKGKDTRVRVAEASSTAQKFAAVEAAKKYWTEGMLKYKQQAAETKERRDRMREGGMEDVAKANTLRTRDEQKGIEQTRASLPKKFALNIMSFDGFFRWHLGDDSKIYQWVTDSERKAANAYDDAVRAITKSVDDWFTKKAGSRFKGEQLRERMAQTKVAITPEVGEVRTMSQLEMITAKLIWRQEDGKRHMEGRKDENGKVVSSWSYSEKFMEQIEVALSDEARDLMDFLSDAYDAEYEPLNKVYRKLFGIDLPKHLLYSPLTVKPMMKGDAGVDSITGFFSGGLSGIAGALKTRGSSIVEPDFKDALQTYVSHSMQMEHFKAYAEFSREARAIFGRVEFRDQIVRASGEEGATVLDGLLEILEKGGIRSSQIHLEATRTLEKLTGRLSTMILFGKLQTVALNVTQLAATSSEMGVKTFWKQFGKLWFTPTNWAEALRTPYIQRRIDEMPPVVRQVLESNRKLSPSRLSDINDKLGYGISASDGFFTAASYAMTYDWKQEQGREMGMDGELLETWARNETERIMDRIAQPTRKGARSIFENTLGPEGRAFFNFFSEARKNVALVSYAAQKDPSKLAGVAQFVLLNAAMSSVIRAAWADLRDDDEDADEMYWNPGKIALEIAIDPLYGIPVVGGMLQDAIKSAFGYKVFGGSIFESGQNAIPATRRALTLDYDADEIDRIAADLNAILGAFGYFSRDAAALTSITNVIEDALKVYDNLVD